MYDVIYSNNNIVRTYRVMAEDANEADVIVCGLVIAEDVELFTDDMELFVCEVR